MTTRQLHPNATITLGGVTTQVDVGELTVDESWSPYIQGSLEVPFDDPAAAAAIDPRANIRATIKASVAAAPTGAQLRTFDLAVRSRVINYAESVATVEVASDEALLHDYSPLTEDTGCSQMTSLRAVVNYVLNKAIPGAALAATPATDADVTPYWTLQNAVTNPNGQTVDDWASSGNSGVFTPTTMGSPFPPQGTRAMRFTVTAAGIATVLAGGFSTAAARVTGIRVEPGHTYSASAYAVGSVPRAFRVGIDFRDAGGNVLSTLYGPLVNEVAPQFVRGIVTGAVAPPNAINAAVRVETQANTAGQFHYVSNVQLTESAREVPFFDGATPPTAQYSYAWTGTAGLSASVRTAVTERAPESLIWPAGQTAWDFISPLLEAGARRLFCDESRVFRLVDDSYSLPTVVALVPSNSTDAADKISRDDDTWAAGVVVVYSWLDKQLGAQERTDSAGTAGRVVTFKYSKPYPGPGAAATILTSMEARGRSQEVRALTVQNTAPGMSSQISTEGGLLVGRVQAVTFDLFVGLMRVRSRNQGVLTVGMIDALSGTIDALVGTIDAQ